MPTPPANNPASSLYYSERNLKAAYSYLHVAKSRGQNGMPFILNLEHQFLDVHEKVFIGTLSERLEVKSYKPSTSSYYFGPKSHFGLRPMSMLAIGDAIVYQGILNPGIFGKKIDDRLEKNVFANRVSKNEKWFFKKYQKQYDAFVMAQRKAFKAGFRYRIELDIQNYYMSIDHGILRSILTKGILLPDDEVMELLFQLLGKWSEREFQGEINTSNRGLPQGYQASDLLANAYLLPLDGLMRSKFNKEARYLRYNDDMVIMAKDADSVNQIINAVTAELLNLGLAINGKSGFRVVKDEGIFDEMAMAPYGDPDFIGAKYTPDIEAKVGEYLDRIHSGGELLKYESRELKYYLRMGGFYHGMQAKKAALLIFDSPELAFHAAEYLEWNVNSKEVFDVLWSNFKEKSHRLTDWQMYCLVRLFGLSVRARKYGRWAKILGTISASTSWPLRLMSVLLRQEEGMEDGERHVAAFLKESDSPIQSQHALMLAEKFGIAASTLPEVADHQSTSLQIVKEIFTGESITVPDDIPPNEETGRLAKELALIQDIHEKTADTQAKVMELLSATKKQPSCMLRCHLDNAFLHIHFGNNPVASYSCSLQYTHILHHVLEKRELLGKSPAGFTYIETWDRLIATGEKYELDDRPKAKDLRSIKKSVDRHLTKISELLKKDFPTLKTMEIFQTGTKGFTFKI